MCMCVCVSACACVCVRVCVCMGVGTYSKNANVCSLANLGSIIGGTNLQRFTFGLYLVPFTCPTWCLNFLVWRT